MSYATLAEFKAWKRIDSTDTTDDTVIQQCLDGATSYIEGATGRKFIASASTARLFDIPAGRTLNLDDDLLTLTSVKNGDGTAIPNVEFVTSPRTLTPFYALTLKSSSTYYWLFDDDGNSAGVITVTGTWGYSSAAPADVKAACLSIAANVYGRRFGEGQQVATVTGAGVVITPNDVDGVSQKVIDSHMRLY